MTAMPELTAVNYAVKDGVAVIEINRPERMNTLGGSLKPDLETAFFELASRPVS